MLMSNDELAEHIVGAVGGVENVSSVSSCRTRVRLTLRDDSKVDLNSAFRA